MPGGTTHEMNAEATFAAAYSPQGYARFVLGWELYGWQEDALTELGPRGARLAVATCNEAGKTSKLITGAVLWHMAAFSESLTVTTSGSYRQITGQLYPNLQSIGPTLGKEWVFGKDGGKNTATGSRLISFSTDNAGRAEGWHEPPRSKDLTRGGNPLAAFGVDDARWAEMSGESPKTSLLIIVDEAKTVPLEIFEAFERCHASRMMIVSSPGKPEGFFYDCFHGRNAARWETQTVDWTKCPHLHDDPVRRREIEEQLDTLRKELTDSMVWARFPDKGAGQVFDMAAVRRAMQKVGGPAWWGKGEYRRGGLDLSMGGDKQVLAVCDGNKAWFPWEGNERDVERFTDIIIAECKRIRITPSMVSADDGGVGEPIIQRFEQKAFRFPRFDFGGKANDPKLYRNKRAEVYFTLAHRIEAGEVILPNDEELLAEMGWITYEVGEVPLKLTDKKKLPKSPNKADALVMVFEDLPRARAITSLDSEERRRYSVTMQARDTDECGGGTWED